MTDSPPQEEVGRAAGIPVAPARGPGAATVEHAALVQAAASSIDMAAGRDEIAVRDEHAKLWRHVASTPLAAIEWDGEYRVTRYSKRAEDVFGFAPEEVLGKRLDEIPWVPEEDWPSVRAIMRAMATGARPSNVNYNRNVRKDGRIIHCEWYNSAQYDASGKLVSMLSLVLDVTERVRLQEELRLKAEQLFGTNQRLQALMDALPVGVAFSHDVTCNHIEGNGALLRLYDAAPGADLSPTGSGDALARRVRHFHEGRELAPRDLPLQRAITERGEVGPVELDILLPTGRQWTAWVSAAPLLDQEGEAIGAVAVVMDVTEHRRAEEALRTADRRKDEFLAVLSHELRNPLGPIRNAARILDVVDARSERGRRARATIERQISHMVRLVDDLLDVTRISRGKVDLHPEPVDLVELVCRTVEDHRHSLDERGIGVRVDTPPTSAWVHGDPTRLSQVVGNLLHNAAKFTVRGGRVSVQVTVAGSTAVLDVVDDGAGIDPALLGHIFEPFVQAHQSLARTQGGLGLGLALAKGLVELHGGTIVARSDGPGKGSTFEITLPLAAPPADLAAPARATPVASTRRRILIIDDNVDGGRALADLLEVLGHDVSVAFDGTSGIALAREQRPDVILCDLGLPDVDGYQVAARLRQDDTLRSTRLIALSGYAHPEDKARAKRAGFDAHLPKPAPLDQLAALLR